MSCCKNKKKNTEDDEDVVSLGRILGQLPSELPKMVFGSILSILNGLMLPAFSVIFGELFNSFYSTSGSELQNKVNLISLSFLGLAIASFLLSYASNVLWALAGERTATHLREKYLNALLHQEIAFYDQHASGSLTSSLLGDITIVQGGISEKMSQAFSFLAQMAGGVIIAFVFGWKMTLVMLAASPLMIAVGALQTFILTSSNKSGKKVYAQANEVAAESLGGIRTVYSFVAEEVLTKKYSVLLQTALINNAKKAHLVSAGIGFSFFFMFGVYALGFWYGGKLIVDKDMQPGDVLTVFFSIMIGAMAIGQATQLNPDIAKAKAAATTVFKVIDRVPLIQSNENDGKTIENLRGKIQLKKVSFTYPSRPDTKVCKSMSLTINPGETVALVGPSGSGKSTVIQLLERFYDPQKGKVLVDDTNICEFDLKWYRKNLGLVSQEPILFSGTITENIRFGKGDATMEEVELAAKMANAYDFIVQQPDQFETLVGEKGIQLSGGQKQRVAIARAILKDPKILLLDEATSALDAESESLVQDALDKLMKGRTTVIIAHRLTTIRNADKICVIMNGKIVEEGNHETLLSRGGVYSNLVSKQLSKPTEPNKKKTKKEKKNNKKDLVKINLIDSARFVEDQ